MGRGFLTFRFARWLLAALSVALLSSLPTASSGTEEKAYNLNGKAVDPLQMAPGKTVVLIFVRTDCPVANRYAPTIQRLSAAYAGKAAFYLVYPSKTESAEAIRKHEREYGYTIPALRDPQHVLVKKSQAQVTPEAAVFDANRKLVYHGRIDDLYVDMTRARSVATTHDLADAIQAALDGKPLTAEQMPGVGCYISDLE